MELISKKQLSEIDGFKGYEEETSNFAIAFKFMEKKARIAISNFYVLCSYLDDIIDEPLSTTCTIQKKRERMDEWRGFIRDIYSGNYDPRLKDLAEMLTEFNIPIEHIETLIEGVSADLNKNRYDCLEELHGYCYGVASIVGIVCLYFFGDTSENARKYAENLGYALQITNIMRDIKVDYERNFIYIPQSLFEKYGYTEKQLAESKYNKNFISIMQELADDAEKFYNLADEYLEKCDNKKLFRASEIMKSVYYAIFEKIKQQEYHVFEGKVKLTKWQKVALALKSML